MDAQSTNKVYWQGYLEGRNAIWRKCKMLIAVLVWQTVVMAYVLFANQKIVKQSQGMMQQMVEVIKRCGVG